MKISVVVLVLATTGFGVASAQAASAVRKTLLDGAQVQFDGAYYDFRSAAGKEMIKLWVPPGQTVRGVFISGHGGCCGDSRDFARDENMKAFAARIGFGLAGLHNFSGKEAFEKGSKTFFGALDAFASLGKHKELANVPFSMYGSSNGGATTYAFVTAFPKRALNFVTNVASRFTPPVQGDASLDVPGVIIVGMYDRLGGGSKGVDSAKELISKARALGARWSLIVEQKGHEDGVSMDVFLKLTEKALAARYPKSLDPAKGAVALLSVKEEAGWLADQSSWDSGITNVAPYAAYTGDKAAAGWLLDQDMAFVYRGAATHDSPVDVGVAQMDRVYNANVAPTTMFSVGGPVVEPDRELRVVGDILNMPHWKKVEFFDGARKLAEAAAPTEPTAVIRIEAGRLVYALNAVATDANGQLRASRPFTFFVRDAAIPLSVDSETKLPVFKAPIVSAGSKTAAADGKSPHADPNDGVLVSYGLDAAQEASFGAVPGQISPFWSAITGDAVTLTSEQHGDKGSAFSIVTLADCGVTVKSAHSQRGLYLAFSVQDNNFSEPDPADYIQTDALTVLLDSKSSEVINRTSTEKDYLNLDWALTLTTKQYQVAVGNRTAPATMRRNVPDPWDMAYKTVSMQDAARAYGIRVNHARNGRMFRDQEWFIPWSELGDGSLKSEPKLGTRFGFSVGYADRDGSEVKKLRWIDRSSPWQHAGPKGVAPRGWGDIEVGPRLTTPFEKHAMN